MEFVDDPDVTVSKVYFVEDGQIQVHQSRVKACPPHFPHGFYWYGCRRRKPGRPPKWVAQVLDEQLDPEEPEEEQSESSEPGEEEFLETPGDKDLPTDEVPETELNSTLEEEEAQPPSRYPLRSCARDRAVLFIVGKGSPMMM